MTAATIDQLRRSPRQARSRDRVEGFLDAGDALLAAEGSSGLSTVRVAEEAGASIGTLYHWFPDKEAIAEALALRYWDELAELIEGVADATEHGEVEAPIERTLEVLAAGFRARPGFLALWFGGLRTEGVRDATRPVRERAAAAIERLLVVIAPGSDRALRARVASVLAVMGDGLLREAFRLDPDGQPELLAEGAIALRAYATARLGIQEPNR
jgi:AcrR family transcriptional regulator